MAYRYQRTGKAPPEARSNPGGNAGSGSGGGTVVSLSEIGRRVMAAQIRPRAAAKAAAEPGLPWKPPAEPSPEAENEPAGAQSGAQLPASSDDPEITGMQAAILSGDRFLHEQIGRLSTSTLAPVLNAAHRRLRWIWVAFVGCAALLWLTLSSGNGKWTGFAVAVAAIVLPLGLLLDRYRRTVRVRYVLRGAAEKVSNALAASFTELAKCSAIWLLDSAAYTAEAKVKKRHPITLQMKRPGCMRGKLTFPCIETDAIQLYFLPDALLAVKHGSIESLRYQDIAVDNIEVRFIQDGTAPPDTSVVGETWKFLDKHGGPDRRRATNERLAVCLYGELHLRLPNSPGVRMQYSNARAADRLVRFLDALRRADPKVLQAGSMVAYERAQAWPAVALCALFLVCAALPVAALTQMKVPSIAWLRFDPVTSGIAAKPVPTVRPNWKPAPPAGPVTTVPMPRAKPKETAAAAPAAPAPPTAEPPRPPAQRRSEPSLPTEARY